jgi:hypothetical protein
MIIEESERDATTVSAVQDHQSKKGSLADRVLGGRDWLVRLTLSVKEWIKAELEIRSDRGAG